MSQKYSQKSTNCNFTSFLTKVKCCEFIFRKLTKNLKTDSVKMP